MKLLVLAFTLLTIAAAQGEEEETQPEPDLLATQTIGAVYEGVKKPQSASDPQYWTDGIAFVSTADDGSQYFWMEHTIHTPPVKPGTEIQIDLWVQLNPANFTPEESPIPTII